MARTKGSTAEAEAPDTSTDESEVTPTEAPITETSVDQEAPAPAAPVKVELTEDEIKAAVEAFQLEAEKAVAQRDEKTGTLSDEVIAEINKVYSALAGGVKVKNAAKRSLNDSMTVAMEKMDVVLARAYMELGVKLSAASSKSSTPRAPKEPVNPTEAFIERVAVLNLAYNLATASTPEGVDADWSEKSAALVSEAAQAAPAYQAWLTSDAEDKGDEPDVSSVVKAAVKLSLGKSAKPGKSAAKSTGTSTYEGERRNIAKHIDEAFAGQESGAFLSIAEIRNFTSEEYGSDHPSPGAISARLFPKSGKCTLEGVTPATSESGNKGAQKN